jgi:hypothetical protein
VLPVYVSRVRSFLPLLEMASLKDLVDALVCDYLIKEDPHLGKSFKKKTLAVCEDTHVYYLLLWSRSLSLVTS